MVVGPLRQFEGPQWAVGSHSWKGIAATLRSDINTTLLLNGAWGWVTVPAGE